MPNAFIVESYVPGGTEADFRRGTAELDRYRDRIELVHAAYVPADQAAYWVVRAVSPRTVEEAWAAAGVAADRVLAAVVVEPAHPAADD